MTASKSLRPFLESPRHPRVAAVRRLKAKASLRRAAGRFVLEGVRLVRDALEAGAVLEELFVRADLAGDGGSEARDAVAELVDQARSRGAFVAFCGPRAIAALCDTEQPQGVVAVVQAPPRRPEAWQKTGSLALLVDGVQDPGNVGSLIRTAAAAGADGVVLGPDSADPFGPKAVRAAAGALFRVSVERVRGPGELDDLAARLERATWAVAALVPRGGVAYHRADLLGRLALVVGSEGHGVREALLGRCSLKLTIPMAAGVESLNVAAAAAVVLFEARRQREVAGNPAG